MKSKTIFPKMAALIIIGAMAMTHPAYADCAPGTKVDGSTVESATKQLEAAGFRQIHDLKKGCDNFWHGSADKDGSTRNVVVSPEGEVRIDGD